MGQILYVENQPKPDLSGSFFARQFAATATTGQRVFDITFGIAAPLLCFYADPIVFRSSQSILGGPALYARYQLFAYLVSAIAIAMLLIWLCLEEHLDAWCPFISGIFTAGAAFSTAIGIVILPYSLIGLIFVLGIVGFIPFLTAFVYLRNGVKGFRRSRHNDIALKAGVLLAGLITIGFPAAISYEVDKTISQSVEDLLKNDGAYAQNIIDRIRWIPLLPEGPLEPLVSAYERASDPRKKEALKKYYRDATGEDIELRIAIYND